MKEYLVKYKWHMIWAGIFVFLIHGSKLHSNIIGIDTEDLMHLQTTFYDGWLNTGRQGLVLLKYLTGSVAFNPYFAGAMTLVLLVVAVTGMVVLWDAAAGRGGQGSVYAGVGAMFLWIAHPVMVEQFYFSLQSVEICIGILLTTVALWLVWRCVNGKEDTQIVHKWSAGTVCSQLLAMFLLIIGFSIYQIFVVLFIFGAVTMLLLDMLRENSGKQKVSRVAKSVLPYAGVFLGAFAGNSVITKLFFSGSDYLNNQIQWGRLSLRDCVYSIAVHVRDVWMGQNSIFYSWVFGALCLLGLIAVTLLVKRCGFSILFYYVALLTTPFLMTVVCADVPAVRSQLILPVATGFMVYLNAVLIDKLTGKESAQSSKNKSFSVHPAMAVLIVLCVVGAVSEARMSLRLYYTDACRYAQDEALGRVLIQELELLIGEDDTPIVVLGSREFQGNHACVEGEIIGVSFFEHDVNEEPQYYWSTRRVVGFLHALGYDCEQLSDRNIPYAVDFAEDMDVWPGERSVEHAGDMVVIKLSEL